MTVGTHLSYCTESTSFSKIDSTHYLGNLIQILEQMQQESIELSGRGVRFNGRMKCKPVVQMLFQKQSHVCCSQVQMVSFAFSWLRIVEQHCYQYVTRTTFPASLTHNAPEELMSWTTSCILKPVSRSCFCILLLLWDPEKLRNQAAAGGLWSPLSWIQIQGCRIHLASTDHFVLLLIYLNWSDPT